MLILTRKPGESLYIGDNIKVSIVEIKGNQIRVGIEAPTELRIYREEIYLQILDENRKAAQMTGLESADLEQLTEAWTSRLSSGGSEGDDDKPKRKFGLSSQPVREGRAGDDKKRFGKEAPQVTMKRRKTNPNDE